eukprot:47973-Pelagomonas_calceolata.AAC.5
MDAQLCAMFACCLGANRHEWGMQFAGYCFFCPCACDCHGESSAAYRGTLFVTVKCMHACGWKLCAT